MHSMKTNKRNHPAHPAKRLHSQFTLKPWHIIAASAAATVVIFVVYGPALNGPFVFDDMYLPFYSLHFGETALKDAMHGVRPLLMVTYWINHRLSGLEPYGYHLFNVLLHLVNGFLVFFIARKFLEMAGMEAGLHRELLAAFAGAVFLLHPVQTESVAYVASRSETLSVMFFYTAFALFLYRKKEAVSWPVAVGVLILFGAAASTKEHTVVLPALLLLTDCFWSSGRYWHAIRRNWRLYTPLVVAAALGLAWVWRVLENAPTAGFGMRDLPWQHYFYTQWRAMWVYFRLFLFPVRLNADYDYPISRNVLDRGALFGLLGLILVVGMAMYFRRRYTLAAYGLLVTLVLFAPTSSVVPIQDAVAERRLYLPMIGLLLVTLDVLSRWRMNRMVVAGALSTVLLVFSVLTYQRNKVWSNEVALWEDTVAKSPHNARAHAQLGLAYYAIGRYDAAIKHYEISSQLKKPDYRLLIDWAMAENRLHHPEAAIEKLRQSLQLHKSVYAYALLGMVYAQQKRLEEALAALNTAAEFKPDYDMTYAYRGNVYVMMNKANEALRDYHRALELNPDNSSARNNLMRLQSRLGGRQ